jgi:hypothetical protein
MKLIIRTIILLILIAGAYLLGTTQKEVREVEKIVEKPIEKIVEVEKIVEKPVEVEKKVPVIQKVPEVITKVEKKECTPQIVYNTEALEALERYVIATINSYPPEEAVDRLYDAIIIPDWKK